MIAEGVDKAWKEGSLKQSILTTFYMKRTLDFITAYVEINSILTWGETYILFIYHVYMFTIVERYQYIIINQYSFI